MRVIFFGTPDFASECLLFLLNHKVQVVAVVTQPDRPQGRSLKVAASAVKNLIVNHAPNIPILQPEKASDPAFLEALAKLKPDLFVVVVFGQILPQRLLDIPKLGSINVHPSLLPKFRGAAPIRRALMEGEAETGVAIQKVVRQLDAGDVLALAKIPIPEDMNHGELEKKLLDVSKSLLMDVIRQYEKEEPKGAPQSHENATYASKITSEEGEIHWRDSNKKIHNKIRALAPRPGAWVLTKQGKRVKILCSKLAQGKGAPGEILSYADGVIACGEGAIQLIQVQPEGKKMMSASDWFRGIPEGAEIFS